MMQQVERFKTEKAEVSTKLELGQQKIANLERENVKLYRMTIDLPTS